MKLTNRPEFKEGDKVTYKPYGEAYEARVRDVSFMRDQYIYDLGSVRDSKDNVQAVTSGRSIVESIYYQEY